MQDDAAEDQEPQVTQARNMRHEHRRNRHCCVTFEI